MSSSDPSQFYANELCRSLTEQLFGIKTFSVAGITSLHATASVTLLEGLEIIIKLTSRGYHMETSECTEGNMVFESVENLLQSVSNKYEQKRHEVWTQKLEDILLPG